MGERYERWRTVLRSDRAENVFGVGLICLLSAAALSMVVLAARSVVWGEAWAAMATYAGSSLAAGTALAVLVPRWPARWMQGARRNLRSAHWALTAMWIPIGVFLALPAAPSFAESYACERGEGVLVTTSWTDTDESAGTKTGVYTYGGKTYDLRVSDEEWHVRQAGPPVPPTADYPYYTRTYRVPWPGAGVVCGNAESSDQEDLVVIGVMGGLGSALAVTAALALVQRRTRRPSPTGG